MAATGLDEGRLTEAIVGRLKDEIGAKEKDEEGQDTALRKVAAIIAEEVIKELKQAIVTVNIPAGAVVVNVTGGSGAPAVGVLNPSPIQVDNTVSGGLS